MRPFLALLLVGVSAVVARASEPYRQILLRIEPPQEVAAITIQATDGVHSVVVKDGKALIPAELPLPWTIGQTRFEPTTYTQADLDQRRPLALRELGTLSGALARPAAQGESFTWLLQRRGSDTVQEVDCALRKDGTFAIRLAAGSYDGALVGSSNAMRIRPGIVIRPGAATTLGTVILEPVIEVTLRVTDAKGTVPIAGARLLWSAL